MNSQQLSEELGVSPQYLRLITKKALDKGIHSFERGYDTFSIAIVSNTTGKAYTYKRIATLSHKPKRRVSSDFNINPNDLPTFVDFDKPTAKERLDLVQFINTTRHPISHIAQLYCSKCNSKTSKSSITAKFKRWIKLFKEKGASALQDNRGGKDFKADLELVTEVLYATGTKHYKTIYSDYCQTYAQRNNLTVNLRNLSADISESAFNRSARHVLKNNQLLREFKRIGQDAFVYAEPSFGREWEYANEQWEIDATPLDIMCKVPHTDGVRDYTNKTASDNYHLVRPQLIAIIDNKTGARVSAVFQSSNTYSNLRLLYKAFKKLGVPETIKGDNGADYVSEHMQGVLEELGINYIRTGKARGDQKGKIERVFRTLQHSSEFENLAGFVGHNVEQRQHLENEASTKLEKLSGVQTHLKANFMWWWEIENWIDNYLIYKDENKYAQHSSVDVDLNTIYRTLGKKSNKKVSKEGIRHRNTHFLSLEMWQQITIGDEVEIRENIDDSNKLFLFKNGEFIGEIQDKKVLRDAIGMSVEDIKSNKKAYKQRVVKAVKTRTKQAQKSYREHQDAMRDEFLDIETAQADMRKEKVDKTSEATDYQNMVLELLANE